jgi:hypothetical protein
MLKASGDDVLVVDWAATMAEAVEWTTQRLIDCGVPLTAGTRELHAEVTAERTRGKQAAR